MGGGLIGQAISRPVGVLVGVILVLLFGWLQVDELPIQLTPDIEVPTLTVSTSWPGAAPAEVEREILAEQEEVLKSVPGLVRMTAEAGDSQGTVTLELEVGSDLDESVVRVTNRLAQVPSYPETAREPVVDTSSSTGPPLAVLLVRSANGQAVSPHRTWVLEEIAPRLERVEGVAAVRVFGGRDEQIEILFEPAALAARGLTLSQVAAAVRGQLSDISGGDITLGKRRLVVRTAVAPEVPASLESLVLKVGEDGAPVLLGDVATVQLGLAKPTGRVLSDGEESIAMLFSREAGSNVLEVTEEIHAAVDRLQIERMEPRGLRLDVVADQTGYINGALDLVRKNLLLGGALAVVVLMVFLRSIAASAVVATAIPVCVMGTVLGMSLMGRTVNVVSLAGMAFAIGMVVDNAIVVLENIDTWRRKEPDAAVAALQGTREVWGAILASTLTTAAVFIPIIGWQDEVGELLRDVAVAITFAVFLSLAVSVLVIPSFSARLLSGSPTENGSALAARGERVRTWISGFVTRLCSSTWRSVAVVGLAVSLALGTIGALVPSMEYLPTGSRNLLFGVVVPPPGYAVDEMFRVGEGVQEQILAHRGVEVDGVPSVDRTFFVATPGNAFMGASAEDPERIGDLVTWIRGVLRGIPGVFAIANQASLFGRSIGSSRSVEVEITGGDLEVLIGLGGRLMGELSAALPGAQIRPVPSLDLGGPELRVEPRREQAAALGLSPSELGQTVDALVDGRIIGELSRAGEAQVDVVLRAAGGGPASPRELAAAQIATPGGRVVPVSAVAVVSESITPTVIQHIERRRAISLQVSPPDDLAVEAAMAIIRDQVIGPLAAEGGLPDGVRVDLAGVAGKLEQAQSQMAAVLGMAVLISFLLLSALYEDFLAPVVVLVTVPLAGAGGVVGLRLVDALLGPQPLDMLTALGFVILVGVVVNNAILVVDGALARLRAGEVLADSLGGAVRARVRPIFMSTLTSLAGLTPLVLFPGSGSELYRGVGAVVLGGLALSTLLTLFVVPALFAVLWRLRGRG